MGCLPLVFLVVENTLRIPLDCDIEPSVDELLGRRRSQRRTTLKLLLRAAQPKRLTSGRHFELELEQANRGVVAVEQLKNTSSKSELINHKTVESKMR